MEREGSGYDKMYEIQLSNGKQVPRVKEGSDFFTAIVERRIISKEDIKVIRGALQIADLKQKQIICLGLIAQYESISAANLIRILNLKDRDALSPWLDPLLEYNIVHSVGSHKAKEYRISTHILRQSEYKGKTTLKRIEDYRIKELIIEDLRIYKCAPLKDIHQRIGKEIAYKKILAQIKSLVRDGIIEEVGVNRWVQYRLISKT
jgi:ATP-dependent DNA helicase RecG